MTLNSFVAYVKQFWKNKPDASTPLSAERLTHMEEGIKGNSNAIETIAAAVVNQIVNDPDKIASMAALYSVNQKIGDVSKLPDSAVDVVTAIAKQNSNITAIRKRVYGSYWVSDSGGKTYLTISLNDFGFTGTISEYPCAQVSVQTSNTNVNSDVCALSYKVQNNEQITVFLNKAFTGGLTIAVAINLQ